jgi:hypothetical protein
LRHEYLAENSPARWKVAPELAVGTGAAARLPIARPCQAGFASELLTCTITSDDNFGIEHREEAGWIAQTNLVRLTCQADVVQTIQHHLSIERRHIPEPTTNFGNTCDIAFNDAPGGIYQLRRHRSEIQPANG